jgi:hypothetical protein
MANAQTSLTPREQLQQKFNTSRMNLLLMIILTLANVVMLIAGSDTMMLFSASIPFYAIAFPVILEMPDLFIPGVIVAFVTLLLYFLCWLLSKKRPGWLIFALVLFVLDTLAMGAMYLLIEDLSGILDVIIHIMVLVYLIQGIIASAKLKKLPEEVPATVEPMTEPTTALDFEE